MMADSAPAENEVHDAAQGMKKGNPYLPNRKRDWQGRNRGQQDCQRQDPHREGMNRDKKGNIRERLAAVSGPTTNLQDREGEPPKKFIKRCVGNLPSSITEEEFKMFEQFGELGEVSLNRQKGFGIVELDTQHNAEVAKAAFRMDKSHVQAPLSSTKPIVNSCTTEREFHGENKVTSYSMPCCRTRIPPAVRKMNKVNKLVQRMPLMVESNPDNNSDEGGEESRGSFTSREYSDTLKQDEPERASHSSPSIQTPHLRSKTALSNTSCSASHQKKTDGLAEEQKSICDNFKPLSPEEDDIHDHSHNRKDRPDADQTSWKRQTEMPEAPHPDLKWQQTNPTDLLKKPQVIEVNGKEYNILNILGKGASSKVYQVYDVKKSIFAIKKVYLDKVDKSMRKGFINEITLLQKLQNSEWVVKMYDYEYRESEDRLLVVMEKGDTDVVSMLRSIMKSRRLSLVEILFYFSQMLKAVADIHKAGIIHLDLKPSNFISVAGKIKLIDFGLASIVPKNMTCVYKNSQVGTLNFMSPEATQDIRSFQSSDSGNSYKPVIKVSAKSDVWSLGCILYYLIYRRRPFQHIIDHQEKIQAIVSEKHQIAFPEIKNIQLLNILKSCLQRDPKQRPSVEELMNHPYLAPQIHALRQSFSSSQTSGTSQLLSVFANFLLLPLRAVQQVAQVLANLASSKQTSYPALP